MLSEKDRTIIVNYAKKYNLKKVLLFGSAKERENSVDIDLGVLGLADDRFFDFFWELYRDLSKPVDLIDLSKDSLFNRLIERDGEVLYG